MSCGRIQRANTLHGADITPYPHPFDKDYPRPHAHPCPGPNAHPHRCVEVDCRRPPLAASLAPPPCSTCGAPICVILATFLRSHFGTLLTLRPLQQEKRKGVLGEGGGVTPKSIGWSSTGRPCIYFKTERCLGGEQRRGATAVVSIGWSSGNRTRILLQDEAPQ